MIHKTGTPTRPRHWTPHVPLSSQHSLKSILMRCNLWPLSLAQISGCERGDLGTGRPKVTALGTVLLCPYLQRLPVSPPDPGPRGPQRGAASPPVWWLAHSEGPNGHRGADTPRPPSRMSVSLRICPQPPPLVPLNRPAGRPSRDTPATPRSRKPTVCPATGLQGCTLKTPPRGSTGFASLPPAHRPVRPSRTGT